jgi:hypothetical protein
MKYCPYNHVWMCKLIINHVLYSCLHALTSAPIFTFSWGPLRPQGGSTTTAPTSFHNQPRSCGTHYTLNLDYNGSLSFNNIYIFLHTFPICLPWAVSPMSQKCTKNWSFVVARGTAPEKWFFEVEKITLSIFHMYSTNPQTFSSNRFV